MNGICKDIFKAIHEGKWLSIEYKNKSQNTTSRRWTYKKLSEKIKFLLTRFITHGIIADDTGNHW